MKTLKIFFSETTMPRALIFSMKHHLVDLHQFYSNYPPGAKMALSQSHLSHRLMVIYCDLGYLSSDVRRQQLIQRTSPPKLLTGF